MTCQRTWPLVLVAQGKTFHVAGSSPDSSDLHKHITLPQLLELADPPMKLQEGNRAHISSSHVKLVLLETLHNRSIY